MGESSSKIWMGIGLALVLFLVVTTPGWKDVLGVKGSFSLGGYAPALILLLIMGGLLGFMLMGGSSGKEE